eukprot:5518388-Pleurochrysis_carterae.AAC.1
MHTQGAPEQRAGSIAMKNLGVTVKEVSNGSEALLSRPDHDTPINYNQSPSLAMHRTQTYFSASYGSPPLTSPLSTAVFTAEPEQSRPPSSG